MNKEKNNKDKRDISNSANGRKGLEYDDAVNVSEGNMKISLKKQINKFIFTD